MVCCSACVTSHFLASLAVDERMSCSESDPVTPVSLAWRPSWQEFQLAGADEVPFVAQAVRGFLQSVSIAPA